MGPRRLGPPYGNARRAAESCGLRFYQEERPLATNRRATRHAAAHKREGLPLNARGLTHGDHRDAPRGRREKRPVRYRALCHGAYPDERDNALLTAGKKFFGDWDEALRAARIEPRHVQADWRLVKATQILSRNGPEGAS